MSIGRHQGPTATRSSTISEITQITHGHGAQGNRPYCLVQISLDNGKSVHLELETVAAEELASLLIASSFKARKLAATHRKHTRIIRKVRHGKKKKKGTGR